MVLLFILLQTENISFSRELHHNKLGSIILSSNHTSLICKKCNGQIQGKYINLKGNSYHGECFVCKKCNRLIHQKYKIHNDHFYHPQCYKEERGLYCHQCEHLLDDKWNTYGGNKYHPECFREHIQPKCEICGLTIIGEYTDDPNGKYHIGCYKSNKLPKCDICIKPIEGKYIIDSWGNQSHEWHESKVKICSSCTRIVSRRTSNGGFEYSDSRVICGFCREDAVFDTKTVDACYVESKYMLKRLGVSGFPIKIQIKLVDRDSMKTTAGSMKNKNMKGFTKSHINYIKRSTHTIYILYGLPVDEFLGILTHELMHVWLNENNIKMSEMDTEGFCNLGTREVYLMKNSQLSLSLLENMKNDPDPVYGSGYRKMLSRLKDKGWYQLLKEIKR